MLKNVSIIVLALYLGIPVPGASSITGTISDSRVRGTLFFENFYPNEYDGHGQNWAVEQDSNGIIYIANSGGSVLQYDAVNWKSVPVGNGSIVRVIEIDSTGKLFLGMQGDFGYLDSQNNGSFIYKSLISRINCKHKEFQNIWKILFSRNRIFFLERNHLFYLNRTELSDTTQNIEVIHTKSRFHNMFLSEDKHLFVHQMDVGLMQFEDDSLRLIKNGEFFKNDLLAAILPADSLRQIIVTRKRGLYYYSNFGEIYPLRTDLDKRFSNAMLYHAIRLDDGNYALASKYGGLYIINASGQLMHKLEKDDGLSSNTVWSVFQDRQGALWLTLNKGITHVNYTFPFTRLDQRHGLQGTVHDIIRHQGTLYVTTNFGLFKLNQTLKRFEHVQGINTSGWDMLPLGNRLLICANSGLYQLEKDKAQLLFPYDPWVLHQSKIDKRRVFIGLANGVASMYLQDNGRWKNEGKIPGLEIEARTLAVEKSGRLWVASSYQGVARVDNLDLYFNTNAQPAIDYYSVKDGLPSNLSTLLIEFGGKIRYSTPAGMYCFNDGKSRFYKDSSFSELNKKVRNNSSYMLPAGDENGNVWCNIKQHIAYNEIGPAKTYTLIDTFFWGLPEEEIQAIFPEQDATCWFGHRNGLYYFSDTKMSLERSPFRVLVRRVLLNADSVLYGGLRVPDYKKPVLDYHINNRFRFQFAAPYFISPEKTEYQYKLAGFDEVWLNWTKETSKDYTNLPEGDYTFLVRAKNVYGQKAETDAFSFSILPPWYRTTWAFSLYLLLFILGSSVFSYWLIAYSRKKTLIEHQKKEEQRRVAEENLRSQVAADFHDELGTRISRISLFSEILKNDLDNLSESSKNYLHKISLNADGLYNETRDFIWQLDPQKDTLFDLISRLKKFGDELFEDTNIYFKLENEIDHTQSITLNMDCRRNLIRIFKEAMHNALKYAEANQVIFRVSYAAQKIRFSLVDDGMGFDVNKATDGHGLVNMKMRAKKIEADLMIKSEKRQGTEIELWFYYD